MNEQKPPLKPLIEAAKAGDTEAFHKLYTQLVDRVFAYTRARLAEQDAATDCTQQTFIALWKALPRFHYEGDPQFYAFLFTITKRQLMSEWKSHLRQPERMNDGDAYRDHTHNLEDTHLISTLIRELESEDRDILVLHHWSRYTFAEIGEMLSLTETNVRVRHHRILKYLKRRINHHE